MPGLSTLKRHAQVILPAPVAPMILPSALSQTETPQPRTPQRQITAPSKRSTPLNSSLSSPGTTPRSDISTHDVFKGYRAGATCVGVRWVSHGPGETDGEWVGLYSMVSPGRVSLKQRLADIMPKPGVLYAPGQRQAICYTHQEVIGTRIVFKKRKEPGVDAEMDDEEYSPPKRRRRRVLVRSVSWLSARPRGSPMRDQSGSKRAGMD